MTERATEGTEPDLYPAEMGHLPPKFVEKAELELSETPQRRKHGIQELRNLMKQHPSINDEWFTDDDIIMYLRCKKYDAHKAFASIKRTVSVIKKHAKIFERVDLKELVNYMNTDFFRIFPYREKDGSVIILAKLREWEPSELDSDKAIVYLTLILWHVLSDPMSQVNGVTIIYDFKAAFLKYLRYTSPMQTYFLYQFVVECVPMRVKFFHGVNPNGLAKIFLPAFLAFAPEKIRNRVKAHSDPAGLLDYLPASLVPNEYGGRLTKQGRMCSWSKKVKIPDYVSKLLNSVKHSS